jgi:hypothetical protein
MNGKSRQNRSMMSWRETGRFWVRFAFSDEHGQKRTFPDISFGVQASARMDLIFKEHCVRALHPRPPTDRN